MFSGGRLGPPGWTRDGSRRRSLIGVRRSVGDNGSITPALLQNIPGQFRGLPSQADDQCGAAPVGEHGTDLGTLGRNAADRAVGQHVDDPPSATGLAHHIGKNMRLTGGTDEPGLYDPIVADRRNTGKNFETPAGGVEIGDVGGDCITPEGILQGCLLIRR